MRIWRIRGKGDPETYLFLLNKTSKQQISWECFNIIPYQFLVTNNMWMWEKKKKKKTHQNDHLETASHFWWRKKILIFIQALNSRQKDLLETYYYKMFLNYILLCIKILLNITHAISLSYHSHLQKQPAAFKPDKMVGSRAIQMCFCFACLPRHFWFSYNMYCESEEMIMEWKIRNEKYAIFRQWNTHVKTRSDRNHKLTLCSRPSAVCSETIIAMERDKMFYFV